MNYRKANPEAFKTMGSLEQYIKNSSLDLKLYEWIKLRASQINSCPYCIDIHSKDLHQMGESMDRILLLSVWREVPIFSVAERAVELTEYATKLSEAGVLSDVYDRVRNHFDEKKSSIC